MGHLLLAMLSALLVAFGLLSFRALPLRELPDVDPPIVSVVTEYRGASASVVAAVSSTSAQPAREIRPSAAMLFRAAAAQSDGSW